MSGEQHHYVPRFLLKNFSQGKKPQIYAFDKSNDNQFRTNIKNVAAEKGFYDLEVDDGIISLEPALANIEANSSNVIKKLLSERNVKSLDEKQITMMAYFMAVQFVRTKEHRLRFQHMGELIAEKLRDMGATEDNIAEQVRSHAGLPEDKLIGIRSILSAHEFVPHFLNKVWVLFETTRRHPFYISDNPLSLHNEIDHGPYGNLGLAVPGIEIYLPISTTLCLGALCPSIAQRFTNAYEQIQAIDKMAPGLADSVMQRPQETRAFCEGMINGTPISIISENVKMMNSLQVTYSSRFVYCETESFGLVKEMIKDNNKYREGLKPSVS